MKQMKTQSSKDTDEMDNEDDNDELFADIGKPQIQWTWTMHDIFNWFFLAEFPIGRNYM